MLGAMLRAAGARGGGEFSPDQVSGLAAWYDPSDLSTMWQDVSGTVPITASGQSVARIDDKSGFGRHATQTTVSRRPLYIDSGGFHKLSFDGVDDYLVTPSFALGGSEVNVFCGVTKNSDASTRVVLTNSDSTTSESGSYALVAPSASGANSYRFIVRSSSKITSVGTGVFAPAPDIAVLSSRARIGNFCALRRNGQAVDDSSITASGTFADRPLYIGTVSDQSLYHDGDIFSLLIYSQLPDFSTELPLLESWVNNKTGAY